MNGLKEMAIKANATDIGQGTAFHFYREDLEAFAKLVEEKTNARANKAWTSFCVKMINEEREACASLVEREWSTAQEKALCDELAAYIRART
jgi:NADH:ubiquinone oxidoreductase subunit D